MEYNPEDFEGKKIAHLEINVNRMRYSKLDAMWEYFLRIAKPFGGINNIVIFTDFKDHDAKKVIEFLQTNNYKIEALITQKSRIGRKH